MSIELEPPLQLSFPRPLADGSSVTLKLRNPTDLTIAFKVKTTAPKQYCVRPNCGNIAPRETVDISVLLQPMKVEPPPGFKCKDKFLVQSVSVAPLEVDLQSTELWLAVEKSRKDEIVEHKLRCTYLDPVIPTTNDTAPGGLETPVPDAAGVPLPGDSPQLRNIHSVAESIYSAAPVPSSSASSTPLATSAQPAAAMQLTPMPEVPVAPSSSTNTSVLPAPAPSAATTSPAAMTSVQAAQVPLPTSSPPTSYSAAIATSSLPIHPISTTGPAAATPEKPAVTATASPAAAVSMQPPARVPAAAAAATPASASTVAALEAKIQQLQAALTDRERQIAQMQVEATQLRQRSASVAKVAPQDVKPQVITRTVVNPSYYSPQLVVIIALVCFLLGVVVF